MTEETPQAAPEAPAQDAPAPVAETPESSPGASDAGDSAQPQKQSGRDKRIDELTWLRRQAERRTKAIESENAELRAQLAQRQPPQQAQEDSPRKTLADFNFDEAAFEKYVEERTEKRNKERSDKERTESSRNQRMSKFQERAEAFRKEAEDYDEVVTYNNNVDVSPQLADLIRSMSDGPQIAYHLGKNPEMASDLSGLPETLAAARLALLSDRLASERAQAKAKPVSKAPPPPPVLEGSSEGTVGVKPDDPESDKLPDAEWTKRRNKQEEQRRRRR